MTDTVRPLRPFLALALLLVAGACQSPPPEIPSTLSMPPAGHLAPPRRELLVRELLRWVADEDPVGCELLVIEHGEVVLHEAAGWSDREKRQPWQRGAICRLRSLTKPYVATLALQLVAEGRLGLDEPITRWLPAFDHDTAASITPRHLLQQTAGFDQPGYPGTLTDYSSLRELADATGRVGPKRAPGTVFIYSDASTAVLGAVVAEVTGQPLEEILKERVLLPLGLEDTLTSWSDDDPRAARLVPTYQITEGGVVRYWDRSHEPLVPWFRASGGLFATAADVASFLAVWLESGEESLELPVDLSQLARSPSRQSRASPYFAYGLHWQLFPSAQPGVWSFGHTGSDGTIAWADPGRDRIVVFLTQTRGTSSVARIPSLIERVLD